MARLKFLLVFANPWLHIDSDGVNYAEPAGHTLHHYPGNPEPHRDMVGARIASVEVLQAARTNVVRGRSTESMAQIQRTRIMYSREAIRVPNQPHYRTLINEGALIAADADSAAQAGIAAEDFMEPLKLLAKYREDAIAQFVAENPNAPDVSEPLTFGEDAPAAHAPADGNTN